MCARVTLQERFRTIRSAYYSGTDCIVVVYDVTNKASYDHIDGLMAEALKFVVRPCVVLIGNKADLKPRQVQNISLLRGDCVILFCCVWHITIFCLSLSVSVSVFLSLDFSESLSLSFRPFLFSISLALLPSSLYLSLSLSALNLSLHSWSRIASLR